jgi:thioredoxin reductase
VIVGGGPAGLSAALVLGRCRRRVLVCDDGRPRNAASRAVHNFLGREATPPAELLRIARRELRPYAVELRHGRVVDAAARAGGFEVRLAGGGRARARKLLIATGVRDNCPDIEGIRSLIGRGVYYCSYCDGYTVRDRPLVALGRGVAGANLALALTTWSGDVTYCTNGTPKPRAGVCERLGACGIPVIATRLARVEGNGRLEALITRRGRRIPCAGLFIQEGDRQQADLAERLGCRITRRGSVRTHAGGRTTVPSLFVAGDAADDVRAVIVAAAGGAKAAFAINEELRKEARSLR